jgi:hypothetical protein
MKIWVVLRGRDRREFRRLFSSKEAASDYIDTGKKADIPSASEEFIEECTVRDE